MEPKWKISVEKREPLRAVYAYALTETPEEDAWKKIQVWAGQKGLLAKEKGTKVFGRNTYPTDNLEPHGYELSLWRWLDESEYEFIGWRKEEHGWVSGYEEHLNPFDNKTQNELLFNLMIPIKK
jgi:hypothetical protein